MKPSVLWVVESAGQRRRLERRLNSVRARLFECEIAGREGEAKRLRVMEADVIAEMTRPQREHVPLTIPKGWQDGTRYAWRLPGVYAVFDERGLAYIGSSLDVSGRLNGHERWKDIPRQKARIKVRYFAPESFGWLTLEARLIARLRPRLNRRAS